MSARTSTALAFGAFALWLALEAAGLTLLAHTWHTRPGDFGDAPASSILGSVVSGVFASVGLLLACRRPRNAIGWIFLGITLSMALQFALGRYALYAATRPGAPPGGLVAAALALTGWVFLISGLALLLLLFPHGRLPSRRWRPVLGVLLLSAAAAWFGGTTTPGRLPKPFASFDNPLGIHGFETADRVLFAFGWAMLIPLVAAGASLVGRFRRSRGTERQQYKWFAFAAALFPVSLVFLQVADAFHWSAGDTLGVWLTPFAATILPIATAVAVLKYRLYEIDRLISRTLVYGALTVILGAAYVGLVLGGQALFSSFAGGSNLAIAVSTLVVAALFLPVRSRVQRLVDRRFYRRRYDAQRTLETFGTRLREQVDFETLRLELRAAVEETMRPAHVSLWLREKVSR